MFRTQHQGALYHAIDLFERALKIAPDDPITLFNLALAYEELAKSVERRSEGYHEQKDLIDKAIEIYQKVLDIDHKNVQAKERMTKLMSS